MKIIINGKFLTQRITGVQRYAREILAELDKICDKTEIEIAVPKDADIQNYKNIKTVVTGKFKGTLWEQISLYRYARKNKAVVLNLCNSTPVRGRNIVVIHDVKIKAHPEFFSKKFRLWYNYLFKKITKKAVQLITVSEFSKSEIVKYYGVDPKKINVIGNAWQHIDRVECDENALKKYGLLKDGYFFAMSSLEPNKNFRWIIRTAENNPDDIFAIAGGVNTKIFADINADIPPNVRFLGYVSDGEAKVLMRDCKAFLFPSFYEGFGIPPMEALAVGAKSLILSDIEVLNEIFKSAATYIDPLKYDYKLDGISKVCSETERTNLLDGYSWEKSAALLRNILEENI